MPMKYSFHPARMAPNSKRRTKERRRLGGWTVGVLACEHEICTNPPPMGIRPKVLIVDDNSDVRRLYAIGLNQRGFEVKLAANGAEAVERVASERPRSEERRVGKECRW